MKGFIKDYRQELKSDIWLMPPLYHRVWQWLKYMVNHEDNEIPMRDGSRMLIKKGQHLTSVRGIAQGVGWYEGARWKEPNPKTITSILKWMEQQGMITITRGKGNRQYTLITLENWGVYQSKKSEGNTKHTGSKQETDINKNDKNDKELNTSRRKQREYEESSPYMKMAKYFLQKIREWKPDYVFRGNMHTWADHFRKIHELDKRSKESIKEVIDWATSDDFWQANILSPAKLRKQFDSLQARMNQEKSRGQGSKVVPIRGVYEPARPNVIPDNTDDILAKYEAALKASQKRAQKG